MCSSNNYNFILTVTIASQLNKTHQRANSFIHTYTASIESCASHPLKASILLMKGKKAGSQMKPASWQVSTQDEASGDRKSRRALRGGQQAGAEMLGAQIRAVEFDSWTKGLGGFPGHDLDSFTAGNGRLW